MHAVETTPAHEPLSQSLAKILKEAPASGRVTMNDLLIRTEGRGLYLLMILLCVPFVPLVSPPGLSGLLGGIVMILSLFLAFGAKPQLPRFIGERPLPRGLREDLLKFLDPPPDAPRARGFKQKLISGGVKFLRFIERGIRPRGTRWMNWRLARSANALLLALMAFLLALPLPSFPWFPTNGLPAYAIIMIAAAMMEEDGVLIWIGYALAAATIGFFISIEHMVVAFFHHAFHWLQQHFAGQ